MRILISGAGVAGPTLAHWLIRNGMEVTLVEQAPALRTGGYIIDFWGAGFDIAERMGLLHDLEARAYKVREVRMVDRAGGRVGGFSAEVFARLTRGRYLSIARGELAAACYRTIETRAEVIFGESIVSLEPEDPQVRVQLARSGRRSYDLVIGADGLHSNVRRLGFGEDRFERYLGCQVAAFEIAHYRPRDPDVYVMYHQVGGQAARFSLRDDRTMFLFVYAQKETGGEQLNDVSAAKARLRRRFAGAGWECDQILAAMETVQDLYFDRVSQIRMERWTKGRLGLVGDAAFCPSLLAGQGAALAMVSAYVLAGELKVAGGDHTRAFNRYQERLGAFIARKQQAAERFARFFAPSSRLRLFLQRQTTRLLNLPLVADLAIGRQLTDEIELPEY